MYKRSCTKCFHCEACSHLDLEGTMFKMDATNCNHYLCVPDPEEFDKQLRALYDDFGIEEGHEQMDSAICELLRQFGYGKAVDSFYATTKWYA